MLSDDEVVEQTLAFGRRQLLLGLGFNINDTIPQSLLYAEYKRAVKEGEHRALPTAKYLRRAKQAYDSLVAKYMPFIRKFVTTKYRAQLNSPAFAAHVDSDELVQEGAFGFYEGTISFDANIAVPTQARLLTRGRFKMIASIRPILAKARRRGAVVIGLPDSIISAVKVNTGGDYNKDDNEPASQVTDIIPDESVQANPEAVLLSKDKVESFRKYAERSTGKQRAVLLTLLDGATAKEAAEANDVVQQFVSQCIGKARMAIA